MKPKKRKKRVAKKSSAAQWRRAALSALAASRASYFPHVSTAGAKVKYRVVTNATVRRVYYVEAANEKAAVDQSVFQVPDDEDDLTEEVIQSAPWPDRSAQPAGAKHVQD